VSNPWFRMYSEAVDDEKLRLLSFEDRWHFVALLCCKSSGILDDKSPLMFRKVAVKLGLDPNALSEVARRLAEVELIDQETLQPLAWDSRQFESDSSKERVKAYRERQKNARNANVTLHDGYTNVTVTAQDTDTDTDKEREGEIPPQTEQTKPPPTVFSTGEPVADHTQRVSNASAVVTTGTQPEKTTTATIPPCPLAELAAIYREELPALPQPRMSLFADSENAKALRQRWRWVLTAKHESGARTGQPLATTQAEGVAWFRRFFVYVAQCDFLTGSNPRGWTADLGWLVKKENFSNVLQGSYVNKTKEVAA